MMVLRLVARLLVGVLLLGVAAPQARARALPSVARGQACVTCLGKPVEVVSPPGAAPPASGIAFASPDIVHLGKPAGDRPLDANYPLGGFHKLGRPLRTGFRPEFLWIGTEASGDDRSAAERWAVVMALEQFGNLTAVKVAQQNCSSAAGNTICDIATFDWSHAICHFPVVLIDGYLQTVPDVLFPYDFQKVLPATGDKPEETTGLAFKDVHDALVEGRNPSGSSLVDHVNGEANLITSLICRADSLQSTKVCSWPVIRQILRHVR